LDKGFRVMQFVQQSVQQNWMGSSSSSQRKGAVCGMKIAGTYEVPS
jgi:hypothetical protein